MMSNAEHILAISSSILYNYFDGSAKLFLNLYLAKFLDTVIPVILFFCVFLIFQQFYVRFAYNIFINDN